VSEATAGMEGKRLGFRRLLPYLRRRKRRLIAGLLLSPVYSGIALLIPWLFRDLLLRLEELEAGGDVALRDPVFWRNWVLILTALGLAHALTRYVTRLLLVGLSRYVEAELRRDLFAHLAKLPIRFFDHARIGDLIQRSTQDIELLRFMAGPTLFFGASVALVLPGALVLLFSLSGPFAFAVLIVYGLVALLLTRFFPLLAERSRIVQDAQADVSAKAQEDFTGIRVLQAFAREDAQIRAFDKEADHCMNAQIEMARSRGLIHGTIVIAGSLGLLTVISAGVLTGMSVADLFAGVFYLGILTLPLLIFGWILQTYHRAKAAADRLDEVFGLDTEKEASPELELPESLEPSIEARRLSFRYSSEAPLALSDISFALPAGHSLGLVGPVGAGKSTLISLLSRFYDPEPGTLFFGGIDVTELPPNVLRSQLSVALQEPFLFGDSLRNNILFGTDLDHFDTTDASHRAEAVTESSRLAQDLEDFDEGLDQVVGERGVTLSGGQKTARIAGARPDRGPPSPDPRRYAQRRRPRDREEDSQESRRAHRAPHDDHCCASTRSRA
jgi:ATP-binding cassette subfamily B multidrug efflux pump